MLQVKMFDLSVKGTVARFFLMMGVTIFVGQTTGMWGVAAILAVTIAVFAILGVSIKMVPKPAATLEKAKILSIVHDGEEEVEIADEVEELLPTG